MAVDDSSKQLCIILGHSIQLYDYKDIIESEVVIDGKSVTKTSRASQFVGTAIGGVLAGGVGAIIGGLSGSTSTKGKVKRIPQLYSTRKLTRQNDTQKCTKTEFYLMKSSPQ